MSYELAVLEQNIRKKRLLVARAINSNDRNARQLTVEWQALCAKRHKIELGLSIKRYFEKPMRKNDVPTA
jgi:hypothetical protein